ncbi:aminotransferase class V-fold PLP-dependent enzyme [Haloimpatiens sp. FM7330]|uniref:aminotransferase class V-fold PLP-dependent enzyme n=1 Tax=Haloimpatiens sp. FM7330 TaxID=3298610 RepID=UPI00363538F2
MIYLDNAATSFPKPQCVYDEVLNCMKNYSANPGRSSHNMAIKADGKIMETREEVSKIFNIQNAFNIIFTNNTTEGLNIALMGTLKKNDHVISTTIEHNSVLRPLNYLKNKGTEVTLLRVDKRGYINLKEIENSIKKNTKAIIINHASNVIGTIQNIECIGKIAKKYGILFIVDAAQSAGVIDVDIEKCNIDILAFPGHKGLLGPQGTGGLYISENVEIGKFKLGGTGSDSHLLEQPNFMPDKFESGTLNTPGIAGLCEGVKFIRKIGIENIRKHEKELTEYLWMELKKVSFIKLYGDFNISKRTAVISFNIDNMDSSDVGYYLNSKGIAVRTGYHCAPLIHKIIGTENMGTVRVSPGYFNSFGDIEYFVETIKKVISDK